MSAHESEWRISLARPDIRDSDRDAVMAVLSTPVLSLGPELVAFEEEFRERLGGRPTVAVSSGTAGIYLALRALGVDGGEVITPSYGFIGTAHAIRLAGAEPRFVDISPQTLCVTADSVAEGRTSDTRAILPADIFGTPAPGDEIAELAQEWGVPVVEDSCEAVGAVRQGRPVGTHGDAGVFAFYPNKQMTTGEGGLVVLRDEGVAEEIASLRNQGREPGEFQFSRVGFNFRLSEIQAALGRSQLRRLDDILETRQVVADSYCQRLADVPGISVLPDVESGDCRSWFVFPVFVADPRWRAPLREALAGRRIQTAPYFPPIHGYEPYRESPRGPLAVTEDVAARSFAIPFHASLSDGDLDEVVGIISQELERLGARDLAPEH